MQWLTSNSQLCGPQFQNPKLLQGQKQNINTVVDVGIVTSFLLPPPSLVADFDSTNWEYDGHNKEQYSPDKPRSHSSTFYIFGKIVLELFADGESGGRMRENTEPICLGCTHVFHWKEILVIKMGQDRILANWGPVSNSRQFSYIHYLMSYKDLYWTINPHVRLKISEDQTIF